MPKPLRSRPLVVTKPIRRNLQSCAKHPWEIRRFSSSTPPASPLQSATPVLAPYVNSSPISPQPCEWQLRDCQSRQLACRSMIRNNVLLRARPSSIGRRWPQSARESDSSTGDMRYAVDLIHPLQAPCASMIRVSKGHEKTCIQSSKREKDSRLSTHQF